MLSKKSFGIAGAAMLGTVALLGTNAAYAVIDLDATDKSDPAATYAKETIIASVEGEDDGTYYRVDSFGGLLNVDGEVGVGGTEGSVLIIQYVLEGMVFTKTSAPAMTIGSTNCDSASPSGGEVATKRGGGDEGEDTVSFIYTRTSNNTDDETHACLQLANIAVSADTGGSVSMNVSDNLPLPATNKASYSGAVRIGAALKPTAMATSPTTTVSSKFLSFADGGDEGTDPDQMATVGSFMVGMADPALINADSGEPVVMADLIAIGDDTVNDVDDDGTDSSVTVTGDFSFASKVTFETFEEGTAFCTGVGDDMRMAPEGEGEDMTRDTTKLKAQTVAYVNAKPNLCIMVLPADDEDAVAIPETGPYMAMTTYAAGTAEAKFAPPMGTHALGMIERDGTTVRLPYLTTNDRFNQRIYIVNRGAAADYVMTFHGDDDEAGMDAEGELMGSGATTILSLRDDDVVTIGPGRTSTSGTIIIEAQPNVIDVATSQINRELGTSDTVVYQEE